MEQVRFCRRLQRTIRLVCEVASGHRPRPDHRHDRKLSDWITLEDIHEHTRSAGWYEKTRLQISLFHAEVGRPDAREINDKPESGGVACSSIAGTTMPTWGQLRRRSGVASVTVPRSG